MDDPFLVRRFESLGDPAGDRNRFVHRDRALLHSLGELRDALAARCDGVLLDNMPPALMREAVSLARGCVTTEASGGITLATIREVAETGVDFISIGALTHSARSLDVSLEVL